MTPSVVPSNESWREAAGPGFLEDEGLNEKAGELQAPAVHAVSVKGDEKVIDAFLTTDFQRINDAYGAFVQAVRPATFSFSEGKQLSFKSGINLWLRQPAEYIHAHQTTVQIVHRLAEDLGLLNNLRGTELVYRDANFHPVQSTVLKY